MKTRFSLVAALLVSLVCANAACADMAFFDGTFSNADWQVSSIFQGYNGGSVSGAQAGSGGNPGTYRIVNTTVNGIGSHPYANVLGFQQRLGATYDPTVQGAISTVDFSIDFLNINTFGNGQQYEIALLQNGLLYGLLPHITQTVTGWQHDSSNGLTANDFYQIVNAPPLFYFDGAHHPDFSATGSPISLGFQTWTATTDVPFTLTVGYDNWGVTVHSIPEPGMFLLAALGGLALLAKTPPVVSRVGGPRAGQE